MVSIPIPAIVNNKLKQNRRYFTHIIPADTIFTVFLRHYTYPRTGKSYFKKSTPDTSFRVSIEIQITGWQVFVIGDRIIKTECCLNFVYLQSECIKYPKMKAMIRSLILMDKFQNILNFKPHFRHVISTTSFFVLNVYTNIFLSKHYIS